MKWQPIDTAPQDGSHILAFWPDVYGNSSAVQVETWWGPSWRSANHNWQNAWDWQDGPTNDPTHWMPLPKPPTTGEAAMTRPDQLGRMAQSFCDMHHDADRHRRRTYVLERVGWALVGAAATVLIALITVAIRAAANATPPTF